MYEKPTLRNALAVGVTLELATELSPRKRPHVLNNKLSDMCVVISQPPEL